MLTRPATAIEIFGSRPAASKHRSRKSIACAYTSVCVASGPNTPSNVYVLDAACAAPVVAPGFPPETALACEDAPGPLAGSGAATTISRRDGFAVTATAAFEARSAAFNGLRVERRAVGQSRTFP